MHMVHQNNKQIKIKENNRLLVNFCYDFAFILGNSNKRTTYNLNVFGSLLFLFVFFSIDMINEAKK